MKQQKLLTLIVVITIIGVSTNMVLQNAEAESLIPTWIKSNAEWWAEDTIDDATFLQGIEYLVENLGPEESTGIATFVYFPNQFGRLNLL